MTKQFISHPRAYTEEEWYEASRVSGTSTISDDIKAAVDPESAAATATNAHPADTFAVAHANPGRDDRNHSTHRSSYVPVVAHEAALDGRRPPNSGVETEPAKRSDEPPADADWEALLMDAFGFSSSTGTASPTHPAEAIDHSIDSGPEASAKHPRSWASQSVSGGDDAEEPWTDEDIEASFREAITESTPPRATDPTKPTVLPQIRVTSGLRALAEAAKNVRDAGGVTEEDAKAASRRRGKGRKTRVIAALNAFVESDNRYQGAREVVAQTRHRYDQVLGTVTSNQHRVEAARAAYTDSIDLEVDFHLSHLASVADRIERCGPHGGLACGSYWCTRCRNRFSGRLIEDTRTQLEQRYGADLEHARSNLLHATILNDIVLPDPDLDREHLADFAASVIRRDHREMLGYLRRWQKDRRSAMSAALIKRGLSLELAEDWIGLHDRDRRFYHPDNVTADADRLIGWNDIVEEARAHFRSQRRRPDLEASDLISCRDDERYEAYLWQLRKATRLEREDIVTLAQGFQCIYREFTAITKTNYPERLKFKSSIEKVMKRERKKLYRIIKEDQLPGIAVTGMFELELVDLRHAIGGDHQHSVKAKTLRVLATQERKPTKKRKKDERISFETERRRMKLRAKMRLLDEARASIAANKDLPEADFPGLRYAVLLHMHVLIDLNGTPREDVERWLTGREVSTRRFSGQWPLPYQVMLKGLYESKSVNDSIRDISFYPIKAPLTFNYENTAPKRDEDLPETDPRHFSDEALAILAWLQQGIGHERLRIAINWPGTEQEKRGPKPKHTPIPKMTEDELDEALAARGSSLPRPPVGETDIGFLFEEPGEGPQAAYRPEASTSTASDGDASRPPDDENPPGEHVSNSGDRGEAGRE
ncbi:hypothetical protein FV242_18990 [Methylobacterium sp. WL64]|uniref:hypothetical protein n=1 Tax=Methylobacterium sp. WL64 TaxID=2603894 RepID=UPI0011CAE4E6|nr:hypothetical protein [Methylobacterium sp. WL64]TXN01308.1 hypothetical protein FV242_18990 [Methylobacterium sp. WL64]